MVMKESYPSIEMVPAEKGTYALLIDLEKDRYLNIGKQGSTYFNRGFYIYCGSAQGKGGLKGRLKILLRRNRRIHWHIDHLLEFSKVLGIYYMVTNENRECIWSQRFGMCSDLTVPCIRFGASDCKENCQAHLFSIPGIHTEENFFGKILENCLEDQLTYVDLSN